MRTEQGMQFAMNTIVPTLTNAVGRQKNFMKTLVLIPVFGISIGTLLFLAFHFLRWLGAAVETNDAVAAVFGVAIVVLLAGTLRK